MTKELKNNIRILMAKNDITSVTKLAEKSGVSRQVLDRLIKGKSQRLDFETVVKLCDALDCSVGDLFYINGEGS